MQIIGFMTGLINLLILFAFALHFPWPVLANFGFQTNPEQMPPAIQQQKDRVFMVYSQKLNQPVGTAYLIYNDGVTALFATARHVILREGIQHWGETLNDLVLLQKGQWKNGVNGNLAHTLKIIANEFSVLIEETKDWKLSGSSSDVGLIKAGSNPSLPKVSLKNLGMSVRNKIGSLNKKEHFILGYPVTHDKDENGSRIAKVQLSLSSGDISYEVPKGEKYVLESTADSRIGNSGSPVFTSEGELLGILSGGGKAHDYVKYPLMNSRIVPIDYLKIHLGNYLMKRKLNIRACRQSVEN